MVQRIEYAVFADTSDAAQMPAANKIMGHIHRSKPAFRAMRDWLREQGVWNKESLDDVLDLFDIRLDKKDGASLGPWALKYFAIDDADEQKTALFERLLDQNTLLVKYVMEALDMDGGGRLHSTYELHRMLTSYVYPGQHIGLPHFQAWIKWMIAADRLKLIGIRWGLTPLGKEVVPKLRMIDVDEFLEDEEEAAEEAAAALAEAAGDGEVAAGEATTPVETGATKTDGATDGATDAAPDSAPEPTATGTTPSEKAEKTPPAPAKSTRDGAGKAAATRAKKTDARKSAAGAEAEKKRPSTAEPTAKTRSDEVPDLPPEAPPIDDAVFEKYAAQFDEPEPPPATDSSEGATAARPATRRNTMAPSDLIRSSALDVACSRDGLDLSEILQALRTHARAKGLGGGSLLVAYGLPARMASSEALRHLFLAGILARLSVARPDGALCELLVERVGGLAPVAVLLDKPEALAEVLVRWGFANADAPSQAIRGALLDAVIGGRALARKPDTPTLLAEAATPEVLVGMLAQGLLRGAPATAAFWLAREMVRIEAWKHPASRDIAFVPTRANRAMAYRLRLIDSHFAATTSKLIEIARTLAKALPNGSLEAAAFDDLAPSDHLRFDCPLVPVCQTPCGWHQEH